MSKVNGGSTPQLAPPTDLKAQGYKAELALEKQKGHVDTKNAQNQQDMFQSLQGWLASNPGKTQNDFAHQEAGKTGLSVNQVNDMVHAYLSAKPANAKP